MLEFKHIFDWDKVEILDFEPRYQKRLISEMIHIKSPKNSINLNEDTKLLDDVYFNLLHRIAYNDFKR